MRKLYALLLLIGMTLFAGNYAIAQDEAAAQDTASTEQVEEAAPADEEVAAAPTMEEGVPQMSGYQMIIKYFIDGSWQWMTPVLICLIIGLAYCIERIITLSIASTNTDKLLSRIDEKLKGGDLEGAREVCKATPGPTASILFEGLKNVAKGPESVEKAMVSYGGVQMGLLERGLV